MQTKNINEQEDIDSGNLRVGAYWMGGKLKSDRIEENNAKIKELQGKNPWYLDTPPNLSLTSPKVFLNK